MQIKFFKSTLQRDMTDECERNIAAAIESSPFIRLMIRSLKAKGCPVDFPRHFVCETCENPKLLGGFDQPLAQVFICSNNCRSERKTGQILAHELVHMYDHCAVKLDLNQTDHLACTEIRAANLVHCLGHGNRAKCVRLKAAGSVALVKGISHPEALKAVDRVFDKCFNDLEPVGRKSLSEYDDEMALKEFKNLIGKIHYFK